MIKKSFKIIVFLFVLIIAFILRKKDYAQIPIAGQSVDEYSYSWVGLSLLKTGMPIGISGIPGYQHQFSKYINVDRLYQTLSSDPLSINYPWMDHPPLLGLITGGYAYFAKANVFEDTTALLIRRPIIIIGTISVALLMIFIWINFNFITSIFSGLIYASVPLIVLSSRMVQAENAIIPCLLALMICLSLYFFKKKDIWLILAGIFSGIATLFKLTGVVCYLFVFLSFLNHYGKINQKFLKDYGFYLLISLPISFLFIFYGLAYGFNNFFNIFFSNANRFYGIGPNSIIDLIKSQRLTQHKFLPEIWIIVGWFTFMFSFLKKKKSESSYLIFLSIISYLIVYLFFGSQPYGWYTFPFWPLLILSFSSFIFHSFKENKNIFLTFFISITLLGTNISRVVGIFEFQPFANWWRIGVSGIFLFLIIIYILKKPASIFIKILISLILLISIYFNFKYLQLINIDFWWQNIS
jgi:4-amino-4-deoxy-L-arabinose transferase-like glycosyltransferase